MKKYKKESMTRLEYFWMTFLGGFQWVKWNIKIWKTLVFSDNDNPILYPLFWGDLTLDGMEYIPYSCFQLKEEKNG